MDIAMIILTSISTLATVGSFICALVIRHNVSQISKNKQSAKGDNIQQAGRDIKNG